MAHSLIDPRSRPTVVITIFTPGVCTSVYLHFSKSRKTKQISSEKSTSGTVSLAEWIIDDTLVNFYSVFVSYCAIPPIQMSFIANYEEGIFVRISFFVGSQLGFGKFSIEKEIFNKRALFAIL